MPHATSTAQPAEKPSIIFRATDASNSAQRLRPDEATTAVLDTNVVLDWLLFRDPRTAALDAALQCGRLRWLACTRMREEFDCTLVSATLARWQPERDRLLACFDRYACVLPEPPTAPLRLRCDDPNDQVFVDLALANGAHWLLSHDKAVLRLRRRMPPGGPRIGRLDDWPGA